MKDPSGELIAALYGALFPNVVYPTSGPTVPVYTMPIEWEDRTIDQWIRIGEMRYDEVGPKDAKMTEGTVDIYVDTFFTGKSGGSKVPMNNIANQISLLIDQAFTLSSFTQTLGRVESMEDFDYELDPQGTVFRKLITYKFITEET